MLRRLRSLRNTLDFALRSALRLRRPLPAGAILAHDAALAAELEAFLQRVDLPEATRPLKGADVGCRTFAYGPAIDRHFAARGVALTLHGIELDAWRRFTDLRTRYDHGVHHAAQLRDGHYHAMDFLDFEEPLDVIFLLEPFVTEAPLLRWGLPLSRFQPARLFAHAHALLRERSGVLLVSCPTRGELERARTLWTDAGFKVLQELRQESPKERNAALLRAASRRGEGGQGAHGPTSA